MNAGSEHEAPIPGHYLQRAPSGIVGIVSVILALLMLAFAIAELRRIETVQPGMTFAGAGGPVAADMTVLTLNNEEWRLNGQLVEESDRLFRLSGSAARSNAIVVEYAPSLPSSSLESALETVSRAGFTQVGMRTKEKDSATTAAL